MSLAKNANFRLEALLYGMALPAMFVGALLTVASVPSLSQSLTTGGISGNIAEATGAVIPNATIPHPDLDRGGIQFTKKEKI